MMNTQILIVEDENDMAELLRYNLRKENYETLIALNGEEAIEAVQNHTPDLVLLDIMLPQLNGWEVCRILRENSGGKAVPIIMLTALSDEESRIKGLTLGVDDYMSKPFSIKELLLKIRKSLDRQQTVKRLRIREQEQETSLRYLLHEMRSATAVIGGFSTLALKKDNPRDYLVSINTVAAHAESLLKDVSLLTRLEKEGGSLPVEPIDIAAITKEAVDIVSDTAIQKRLEIIVMKSTRALITASRTAVRQVLVNLLSNAVKYSREGGKVWISLDELNDRIGVSIKDEGCGVRSDELLKIFEKFYRAAGSEKVKGAGLGLYIVKLLTEAMGGTITVVSNQGAGSTFTASFIKANAATLCVDQEVA
jgi:two-component system sensor histidine kinase/response regulator